MLTHLYVNTKPIEKIKIKASLKSCNLNVMMN